MDRVLLVHFATGWSIHFHNTMIKTGIYRIRNIVTNVYEDCYIGSAASKTGFKSRWGNHRRDVKKQKHHSIIFQRAWNKYGADAFVFEMIEYVVRLDEMTDKEWKTFILQREQYYLDIIKPRYNICKKAGSCLGVKHSKVTREKVSKRLIGNKNCLGHKHSDVTKDKISSGHRGEKAYNSRLTECEVREILILAITTGLTHNEIAFEYPINGVSIGYIVSGKRWGHIKLDYKNQLLLEQLRQTGRKRKYEMGEDHFSSKLNQEKADKIRLRIKNGERRKDVALDFNICVSLVSKVCNNQVWVR